MVILCLFPSKAFAELGLIKTPDGHVRLAGVISSRSNGIITAKVIGGNYVHGTAESLSLRSAASGAVSSGKVPATISRTVPTSTVLSKVLTNGRLAGRRLIPYVGWGLLAYDLVNLAATNDGYTWSDEHQDWVRSASSDGYAVIQSNEHDRVPNESLTVAQINNWCSSPGVHVSPYPSARTCKWLGTYRTRSEAQDVRDAACRAISATLDDGRVIKGYYVVAQDYCRSYEGYNMPEPSAFKIFFFADTVVSYKDFQLDLSDISDANAAKWLEAANLSDSDWSAPKVHVLPGTIVNSQPFTDPKDGKAKQARWEFYDCGQNESCVKETLTARPDLQPNSPAAPAPDNPPANGNDTAPGNGDSAGNNTGSGNQSGNEGEQDKDDLCRKYPHIIACDEQPEPGDYDLRIPQETVNLSFHPDNVFSTDAACPAGATFDVFGQTATISLTPACDAARSVRPMLIALAWLAAAFFVIRTVRAAV